MNSQLESNIIALGIWLEETWILVDKVKHNEYHTEAICLITVATRFWELLSNFTDELDEASINYCAFAILNIFSILKYQIKTFRKKGFEVMPDDQQHQMLAVLHKMRKQLNDDFNLLIEEYGLTELY